MRTYPQTFLAWLTLLLILSSVVAAQSQPNENSPDAMRTGKISGLVVTDTGQPLAEALVSIRSYGGSGSRTATTDNDGSFVVSGLDPVAYIVSASFPGYVPAPRDPDVNPIGYYRVGDSVRIQMIKGGVITGTVTMSGGEPVVAVPVRAYMIRDSKGQPARYGTPFQERITDDRGVYRIYGLAPGTYLMAAGGGGRSYSYVVNAYGTDVPTYAPSSTRNTAAEIFVHSGEEIDDVDIRYRGESGHAVSGVVNSKLASDQPQGFGITLISTFNGTSQPSYSSFQPPGGRGFSIYGVADGDYTAIAQSYLPATGESILSEPLRIRVKGSDITGLELTAAPLGSITGHIELADSTAGECKEKRRPLFGETLVTPWHNEKITAKDQPQFIWGLGVPVLPDKRGDFTLRNLAPGQYRFNVRPMAKYWYLKSISWQSSVAALAKATQENRPADAARNWTTLKAGERLSGLTITLAEGAASLQGQIDVTEGRKLPSKMFVYLVPAEREKSNDVLRFFASIVSADGTFEMTNLSPGRYRIVAQTVAENESNILSKLRLPDEVETRAKLLRDAEAIKIETELKPCQNVRDFRIPLKTAGSEQ